MAIFSGDNRLRRYRDQKKIDDSQKSLGFDFINSPIFGTYLWEDVYEGWDFANDDQNDDIITGLKTLFNMNLQSAAILDGADGIRLDASANSYMISDSTIADLLNTEWSIWFNWQLYTNGVDRLFTIVGDSGAGFHDESIDFFGIRGCRYGYTGISTMTANGFFDAATQRNQWIRTYAIHAVDTVTMKTYWGSADRNLPGSPQLIADDKPLSDLGPNNILYLGSNSSGGNRCNCNIRQCIIFQKALTQDDLDFLESIFNIT